MPGIGCLEKLYILFLGYTDVRISGNPDIRISYYRTSGNPGIRISGNPDMRISGYPEIRISGNPDFWVSGFPDIRIAGNPDKSNFDELARKWSFC